MLLHGVEHCMRREHGFGLLGMFLSKPPSSCRATQLNSSELGRQLHHTNYKSQTTSTSLLPRYLGYLYSMRGSCYLYRSRPLSDLRLLRLFLSLTMRVGIFDFGVGRCLKERFDGSFGCAWELPCNTMRSSEDAQWIAFVLVLNEVSRHACSCLVLAKAWLSIRAPRRHERKPEFIYQSSD